MKYATLGLVAALVGCGAPPPAEVSSAAATAPLRAPPSLRAMIQAGDPLLAPRLPPATAASMESALGAHRAGFRFTPDASPKPAAGAPLTRSFIEDSWSLHEKIKKASSAYSPACAASPCILRLDLDGVGAKDAVVSAFDQRLKAQTFAVSSNAVVLIGAGIAGLDLETLKSWRVVDAREVRTTGFTRQGVLIETGTKAPFTRHLLFQDSTGVRIARL